jgi:alpha-L-fucosidase
MRPYEAVAVRGLPVRRVRGASVLPAGEQLETSARCTVADTLFNADPHGELTIRIPERLLDEHATVIAIDLAPGILASGARRT